MVGVEAEQSIMQAVKRVVLASQSVVAKVSLVTMIQMVVWELAAVQEMELQPLKEVVDYKEWEYGGIEGILPGLSEEDRRWEGWRLGR
jgi:hypothetical protein